MYRRRVGLLDYDERMAILLQEVQGERHRQYYFPALAGVEVSAVELGADSARLDLVVALRETPEGLEGMAEYDVDLFDAATIARMMGHFHLLLEGACADPALPLSALPLLGAGERRALLEEWNATGAAYPEDACIHALFEAQAARTPEAVALVFEGERVYDRRVFELAAHGQRLLHSCAILDLDCPYGAAELEMMLDVDSPLGGGTVDMAGDLSRGDHGTATFAAATLVFSITGLFILKLHAAHRPSTWPVVGSSRHVIIDTVVDLALADKGRFRFATGRRHCRRPGFLSIERMRHAACPSPSREAGSTRPRREAAPP